MEALQAVYASSDSSEDEDDAGQSNTKDSASSPRNAAPEKSNLSLLPKKRTREMSPPRSSKRLQEDTTAMKTSATATTSATEVADALIPSFEDIERKEQPDIDKRRQYPGSLGRKQHRSGQLLCPPRQVQTQQENLSTEDLTSYGLKREQKTKNHS